MRIKIAKWLVHNWLAGCDGREIQGIVRLVYTRWYKVINSAGTDKRIKLHRTGSAL
jgi:hypothetical protein